MCLKLASLDEVCTGSPILCFLSIMRVCSLKAGNVCFSERVQRALLCLGILFQLYVGFEPKAASSVPLMVFRSCLCSKEQGAPQTQWRACLDQQGPGCVCPSFWAETRVLCGLAHLISLRGVILCEQKEAEEVEK